MYSSTIVVDWRGDISAFPAECSCQLVRRAIFCSGVLCVGFMFFLPCLVSTCVSIFYPAILKIRYAIFVILGVWKSIITKFISVIENHMFFWFLSDPMVYVLLIMRNLCRCWISMYHFVRIRFFGFLVQRLHQLNLNLIHGNN